MRPLMFSVDGNKAIIHTEKGPVEIFDRDLSRLWHVMSMVMDKADYQIVASDPRVIEAAEGAR